MSGGELLLAHGWKIVAQAGLLICSAFCSGSETAVFSLSRSQLYRLRQGGGPGRLAAALAAHPRRLLNTILLANMVVNTAYVTIGAVMVLSLRQAGLPGWGAGAVSLGLMMLLILAGEVVPKVLALAAGERAALLAAPPLAVLERVLAAPLWVFQNLVIGPVTRLLAVPPDPRGDVSGEELAALLQLSARRGLLQHDANTLLQEIVELKDLRVRDVMVPRVDMVAFDVGGFREDLLALFRRTRFRKVPVYEGDMDNVLGLVYAKKLVLNPDASIRSLVVKAPFVPLQARLERVLLQFRVTRTQTAIVVDEYGGTAGLVTLEDVLEEIVGDIPAADEGDGGPTVERLSDREYRIRGDLPIHEWRDVLKIELPRRRISTLGGFVLSLLGHVPQVGEQARYRNLLFTVESLHGRRIGVLRVLLQEGPT